VAAAVEGDGLDAAEQKPIVDAGQIGAVELLRLIARGRPFAAAAEKTSRR
jgi:hypothetical protein